MSYSLREALAAFRRAPLLTGLSAVMIGLSLFVVGLFGLAAYNIRLVLERVEARVEIVAYLRDDATPEEVTAAQRQIEQYPEVSAVRYVSRREALEIARKELSEFRSVLGTGEDNPLPASLEISLQPHQKGPESVRAVADRVGHYAFVEDVRYGSEWLDKVFLLRRVAGAATLVLGGGFALVAALIIAAAVRIAIFARREEITVMRLVGATDAFVRRPFVLEGLLTGLLGAGMALAGVYGVYLLIYRVVFQLQWLPTEWIVAGAAAGALLGVLASGFSVRRHLREAA